MRLSGILDEGFRRISQAIEGTSIPEQVASNLYTGFLSFVSDFEMNLSDDISDDEFNKALQIFVTRYVETGDLEESLMDYFR